MASIHPKCLRCGKTVYPAELQSMEGRIFHNGCLRCLEPSCNKILTGANWGGFLDDESYCKIHLNRVAQATGRSTSSTKAWKKKERDPNAPRPTSKYGSSTFEKCTGCGKTVYPAEKMSMEGRVYHPGCLRCVECNVKLGGANWGGFIPSDSNTGYCKVHRDQHLASTGGAGIAKTTWVPKVSEPGENKRSSRFGTQNREKCVTCGKTVYPAEKTSMEGRVYHPGCLRCVECNVKLAGGNWGGYIPSDSNDGYCKVHRNQKLAATGGAGLAKTNWVPKPKVEGENKRSSRFGSVPRDKCEKCGKTVYPAEKLSLEGKIFHNGCVRCAECNKSVTGANFGNFTPDGLCYCKVHYDRLIMAAGDSTALSGSKKLEK